MRIYFLRRNIVMSAPADTRPLPVWELLMESWAYWREARLSETAESLRWYEAMDMLLDRLLSEQPKLAIYSMGLVAA